ncbi:hypothetical protein D8S78_21540 [Natrialba swarupiae]|nr:hypothetical protein [Natrialba swarupiae]
MIAPFRQGSTRTRTRYWPARRAIRIGQRMSVTPSRGDDHADVEWLRRPLSVMSKPVIRFTVVNYRRSPTTSLVIGGT